MWPRSPCTSRSTSAAGLPSFTIVGLPDAAVRESRERVRSALVNSGFKYPQHRITANLAPADLRKAGPGFDLAIAAAVLVASGQLPQSVLDRFALAGELALDGAIRPVPGALAMAEGAREWGMRGVAVAPGDAAQAALVGGIEVMPVDHVTKLRELAEGSIQPVPRASPPEIPGRRPPRPRGPARPSHRCAGASRSPPRAPTASC